MTDRLLQESGDKVLQEDAGTILLEASPFMVVINDFLPASAPGPQTKQRWTSRPFPGDKHATGETVFLRIPTGNAWPLIINDRLPLQEPTLRRQRWTAKPLPADKFNAPDSVNWSLFEANVQRAIVNDYLSGSETLWTEIIVIQDPGEVAGFHDTVAWAKQTIFGGNQGIIINDFLPVQDVGFQLVAKHFLQIDDYGALATPRPSWDQQAYTPPGHVIAITETVSGRIQPGITALTAVVSDPLAFTADTVSWFQQLQPFFLTIDESLPLQDGGITVRGQWRRLFTDSFPLTDQLITGPNTYIRLVTDTLAIPDLAGTATTLYRFVQDTAAVGERMTSSVSTYLLQVVDDWLAVEADQSGGKIQPLIIWTVSAADSLAFQDVVTGTATTLKPPRIISCSWGPLPGRTYVH